MAAYESFRVGGGSTGETGSKGSTGLQRAGIISREQLLIFLQKACEAFDRPEIRARISNGVQEGQPAVSVSREIKEEIFLSMSIEPLFGLSCLKKVPLDYGEDREVVYQFCKCCSKEEAACDEAELTPLAFAQKKMQTQVMQQQQLAFFELFRGTSVEEQRSLYQRVYFEVKKLQEERLLMAEPPVMPKEVWEFFYKEYDDKLNERT